MLGTAGILFSSSVARFMGAEGRLLDLTLQYLHITWYLFAAYVYLHLMSAIFQGVGDTRTPLKAMVWVNGRAAGQHEGGNTPFGFDVTPLLASGANTIVVRAEDPPTDRSIPRGKQYWEPQSRGIKFW
jgi:hypothetical protein